MESKTTYSRSEIEDVKRIEKAFSHTESDYEKLKRLVKRAERNASTPSLMVGVVAALILGIGMSLCMTTSSYFVLGIVIGVIGLAIAGVNYPLYRYLLRKEKDRIEEDVLALSAKITG